MHIFAGIILGLIGLLIYLVIKYPDRSIGARPRPDLNGVKGYPLIGNLAELYSKDMTPFIHEILTEYGPNTTYTLPIFGRVITVNSPTLLKHVMKTKFDNYVKGEPFSKIVYDALGDGIFNSDGQMWKFQRKLASHLFNGKKFREIICVIFEEETRTLLDILQNIAKNGDTIDLQDLFFRFTLESFGKITFGTDFECLKHPEKPVLFSQALDFAQSMMDKRFTNPLWPIFELFTQDGAKMRSSCKYLSDYAYYIIKERKDNEEALKDDTDVLNMFMNAEVVDEENGNVRKLNDRELKDIILNLIIAGRDTTAQALSWMMYNIMVNSIVKERLVEEIDSMLDSENSIPHYDNIKQFRYTQAVFYETLRLYPSVPKNAKLCIKDDVLPNGVPIHVGEWVSWSSWAMGRDKRIWGEDAEEFIPERFLESEDGLKPDQYKFNSFNCGPRLCLGQTFATVEAMTVATAMLKQFRFELLPGQKSPPDFAQSLTLPMKDPLLVKVYIRQ